jgi:PucR-like helix-turn-helix protein/diguanylate cyclase with GGDEF domain
LGERKPEIEREILSGVYAVADPAEAADSTYVAGLREAVSIAIDYALEAIERGEGDVPSVPPELLAQARLAARSEVPLDTVLRRYFAGFALLGDFLIQEAQDGRFAGTTLQRLMAGLSAILDRLVAAVSDEHARAGGGMSGSLEERKASHVRRLLAGEFLDAAELAYDFDAHHLGLIAQGEGAPEALRELATALGKRLLSVPAREQVQWGWLGSTGQTDPEQLRELAKRSLPADLRLAIGEPGEGMEGWRLTHRQARAALPIALRGPERLVRYAEVALLASISTDELLVRSLRQIYLEPLEAERDGGEVLRGTLRAYFAAERNVSSAAAALGVSRNTITNRLRAVDDLLGRPLGRCAVEVDAALRLEEMGSMHKLRAVI